MTGPMIRLMREGWSEPVVIAFPEKTDPFELCERCRREVFPGVAVVPYVPKKKRVRK